MRFVRPHLRPEKVSLGLTIAGLAALVGFVLLVAFHEQWGIVHETLTTIRTNFINNFIKDNR